MYMDKDVLLKEIAARARRHLGPEHKLVLFGSWARGAARERSDVDIGILGPTSLPHATYVSIRDDVDAIPTLRHIDIVDLMAVGERFRARAIAEGIVLS